MELCHKYRDRWSFQILISFVAGLALGILVVVVAIACGIVRCNCDDDNCNNNNQSGGAAATTGSHGNLRPDMSLARQQIQVVNHISHVPKRPTSHKGILKQQLVTPFTVHPSLAGVSIGIVAPQQRIGHHQHQSMSEFFYVLQGHGFIQLATTVDNEPMEPLQQGSFVFVGPLQNHSFFVPESASEPLKILYFGLVDN